MSGDVSAVIQNSNHYLLRIMELELIDFLGHLVNAERTKQQGYDVTTRWLCTREDLKEECKKEALKIFEDWKADELMAKKNRDEMSSKIKYVDPT